MGYVNIVPAAAETGASPDWTALRGEFPVTAELVYLNHAAVAPLSKPCAEALRWLADDASRWGSYHYDEWLSAYEALRVAAATLVNGHRDEIALVKNTSEGIATVAMGLDWKPGDKVVAFVEEFPANFFPWKRLEARGVRVEWLSLNDSLERVEEAARGARLLAISFVNYLSGRRVDLDALGEICHRHEVFFFVDAIQGLGAFPIDVRRSRIHALAADGHKWLLGPEGCGVLFIDRAVQDRVEPVEFGWTNIAGYNDYACRDMALRPDAGRYECGTLNTIGCFGLKAAIEFVLSVGPAHIGPRLLELTGRIVDEVRRRGWELMAANPTPATASGIVSFRNPSEDARMTVRRLRDHKVMAAPRQGWVRVSPHFYIDHQDLDRLFAALG